jgi:hypothetical protein
MSYKLSIPSSIRYGTSKLAAIASGSSQLNSENWYKKKEEMKNINWLDFKFIMHFMWSVYNNTAIVGYWISHVMGNSKLSLIGLCIIFYCRTIRHSLSTSRINLTGFRHLLQLKILIKMSYYNEKEPEKSIQTFSFRKVKILSERL